MGRFSCGTCEPALQKHGGLHLKLMGRVHKEDQQQDLQARLRDYLEEADDVV